MNEVITVDEAWGRISDRIQAFPPVPCPLEKAVGKLLREVVRADREIPPFDRVMMDGYALRSGDAQSCTRQFKIAGEQRTGESAVKLPGSNGSALIVATGCMLPVGADCVVPFEWCLHSSDGSGFEISRQHSIAAGQFVHVRGSDATRGDVLIASGTRLHSPEIGIAASCGYARIPVSSSPRIAILATGDELVDIDQTPSDCQIRRSNSPALSAALRRAGYRSNEEIHVKDDLEDLRNHLETLRCTYDFVITVGAISMGKRDFIKEALTDLGAQLHFHGVHQRPGKPMAFWTAVSPGNTCLVFSLPGNPVSALIGLHRYVLPALELACDGRHQEPDTCEFSEEFKFEPYLTCFLPVRLNSRSFAIPAPVGNSGDFSALAGTDGFVELPAALTEFRSGNPVSFYPWM